MQKIQQIVRIIKSSNNPIVDVLPDKGQTCAFSSQRGVFRFAMFSQKRGI